MIFKSDYQRADATAGASALASPKLKEAAAIRELQKAFDENIERFLLYGFVRNGVLTFYFNHQIGVLEFNNRKEDYLKKMRDIYRDKELKRVLFFKKVEAKLKPQSLERKEEQKKREKDISTGNFEIKVKNPDIKRRFEQIQKLIKENNLKI